MSIEPIKTIPTVEWWDNLRHATDGDLRDRRNQIEDQMASLRREVMIIEGEIGRRITSRPREVKDSK